jgi:hypothetical protein
MFSGTHSPLPPPGEFTVAMLESVVLDRWILTPLAMALDFAKIDDVGRLLAGVCFAWDAVGSALGVTFPCGTAGSSARKPAEIAPSAAEAARASNQDRETYLGNIFQLLNVL